LISKKQLLKNKTAPINQPAHGQLESAFFPHKHAHNKQKISKNLILALNLCCLLVPFATRYCQMVYFCSFLYICSYRRCAAGTSAVFKNYL
jgi:hypothetical protein